MARAYADLAAAAARGAVTMNVVEVPFAEAPAAWARVASGAGGRQAGRHPVSEGFAQEMAAGYGFDGPRIHVGRPMAAPGSEPPDTAVDVALPLGFLNRHGLIAGATGTGKTRTLQLIAEQVSAAGCPVFAADMKGDLAGHRRGRGRRARASPSARPSSPTSGRRRLPRWSCCR